LDLEAIVFCFRKEELELETYHDTDSDRETLRVFTFLLILPTDPRPFVEDADNLEFPILSLVCFKFLSPDDEDEGEDNLRAPKAIIGS